jgi:energy-coupling factor transport system ATP-binding protein
VIELVEVGHIHAAGTPWASRAIEGITLRINRGERVLVVGPNGSGKTTLAWIIAGMITPTEGLATFDGDPIDDHRDRIGVAFQHARLQVLKPTICSELAAVTGLDDATVGRLAWQTGLDLDENGDRRIDGLSGGEVRRVVLAGAIARRPRLLVLDEPLAGLDTPGRSALIEQLDSVPGMAIVTVTHDLVSPEGLADRIIELDAGRLTTDSANQPDGSTRPT